MYLANFVDLESLSVQNDKHQDAKRKVAVDKVVGLGRSQSTLEYDAIPPRSPGIRNPFIPRVWKAA